MIRITQLPNYIYFLICHIIFTLIYEYFIRLVSTSFFTLKTADYDSWCNLKRETPENHSSDDSESSVAIKNNTSNQKSYSRHPCSGSRSSSLCETWDSVPPVSSKTKFNRKSLRSRNWDDLMVDLDQDENSQPSSPVKLKKSVNAVESYKQAMKAIGSSKTR